MNFFVILILIVAGLSSCKNSSEVTVEVRSKKYPSGNELFFVEVEEISNDCGAHSIKFDIRINESQPDRQYTYDFGSIASGGKEKADWSVPHWGREEDSNFISNLSYKAEECIDTEPFD